MIAATYTHTHTHAAVRLLKVLGDLINVDRKSICFVRWAKELNQTFVFPRMTFMVFISGD